MLLDLQKYCSDNLYNVQLVHNYGTIKNVSAGRCSLCAPRSPMESAIQPPSQGGMRSW